MAFQPIRRILPDAIHQAGIEEQVSSVRILSLAAQTLEQFWGAEKAQYVEWISFKDGILKAKPLAPAAAQELRSWEVRILNELNRALRAKKISKIVSM